MHKFLEEKLCDIKKLLKTELHEIHDLDHIQLLDYSYKSLLFPTDDLFLYKHQFDAILNLLKSNEKIYMFQIDDTSTVYDISPPFDYNDYKSLNLYSISIIFPNSVDWLVVIDEALHDGIGIFVSVPHLKYKFEKSYDSHYTDLTNFVSSELSDPKKNKSDYLHLKNIISVLNRF